MQIQKFAWQPIAFGIAISCLLAAPAKADPVEGTWRLLKRQLPDGVVISPPAVIGVETWHNGLKHVTVFWTMPDGKPGSFSAVSRYTLSDKEITATLMSLFSDQANGTQPIYMREEVTKTEPVQHDGSAITFRYPMNPATITVDGDKMTAKIDGGAVDTFERVK